MKTKRRPRLAGGGLVGKARHSSLPGKLPAWHGFRRKWHISRTGSSLALQGRAAKGFIGPIGDDLPSLIPIIFALIIYFSTFTTTFSVFEKGNMRFDRTIKVLKVSNDLRGDKYINDAEEFLELCENVTVRGINFKAGLVDLKQHGTQTFQAIDPVKFVNEDQGIYSTLSCSDPGNPATCSTVKLVCPDSVNEMGPDHEAIVKMFPVAFQDIHSVQSKFAVRPMLLVVVVWF